MVSGDAIRDGQRAAWAGLAPGWEKWDAVIMDQLAPVSTVMIDALDIGEAQQHLDVAAGTGEPGLSIAALAPAGHVVLTDLSPEMLAIARRRAEARGATNVSTEVCSVDDLPFGDGSFDSVSVRFGYMFFPDLAAATAEIARVLAPGGGVAAAVWVAPDRNPWTSIVMQAIAAEVTLPPTDPDGPNMFRCAATGAVARLYEAAGLSGITEQDVPVELVTASPREYWDMISEHVSLAVAALRQVDGEARARIEGSVVEAVAAYEKDGTVRVPGLARCITARKRPLATNR